MLTMGQAAIEAGVGKSTLSRAIHSGRLSAARNEAGGFQIDPSELFRVFPPRPAARTGRGQMAHQATAEAAALKAEIEGLRAQLARADARSDELKEERDRWRQQAEAAQRLLADRRPGRGWFGLLRRA